MRSLRDKLSHPSLAQAIKLLGDQGQALIMEGGRYEIDIDAQVRFSRNRFRLILGAAQVVIRLDPQRPRRLVVSCNHCQGACVHQGAALSLILEEKLALSLSAPPKERVPMERLNEATLVKHALAERRQRARDEKMRLKSFDPKRLWTDYVVTNRTSGKSYRVALRGWQAGASYCTCSDFRKNTLGTCKHIIYALERGRTKFSRAVCETPAAIEETCVYLHYGEEIEVRLLIPDKLPPEADRRLAPFRGKAIRDLKRLLGVIERVERLGTTVNIYPDAEAYIQEALLRQRLAAAVAAIRKNPAAHPLRRQLLNAELRPYQLDGIAFAAGAGRAILADDMGLGKTIQGIGVAELLYRHVPLSKVLVICPASLKSQWRIEIRRFCDRSCRLVLGSAKDRALQYQGDQFFTVCNYEQVLRDVLAVERVSWDLIILDEGQRIKNWEAKTSRIVKALKSPFALVLTLRDQITPPDLRSNRRFKLPVAGPQYFPGRFL